MNHSSGRRRAVLAIVLLCLPVVASAAQAPVAAPPPAGVHIAPVNVLANVRRLLARGQHHPQPLPPASQGLGGSSAVAVPVSPPTSPPQQAVSAPARTPQRPDERPVQLPDKVITIRGAEDLRALARELEKAKAQQQR